MTRCEHCVNIVIAGKEQAQCTPLSSAVVVHGTERTLRCHQVQVCPTRGDLSRGRIKGCAVAEIADAHKHKSSPMSKKGWIKFDEELQAAKAIEVQSGRRFSRIRRYRVYDST